ncbi:hypothetical protein [Coleofasciculus sp. FACHB-712]|uniref:hypothetical protein n=1 Tax=Coleofasciculus sp. FACHB-712 TaxID=2692789 RepID=UPI001F5486AD|nr:hypothetical protein [Coleofasciculus sp. FACHB-712]
MKTIVMTEELMDLRNSIIEGRYKETLTILGGLDWIKKWWIELRKFWQLNNYLL